MKNIFTQKTVGQIIVLFAVVLVALLGFTALAVDGAMMYSDKRAVQNVSDSSALAGGGSAAIYFENNSVTYDTFTCANSQVVNGMNAAITGAINSASTNSFTIDNNISDNNGVQVTCNVVNMGSYYDKYIDVKVAVTNATNTSFAQLFNSSAKKETADATVRVHPRTNLSYGYAVVALGSGTCNSNGTGDSGISLSGAFNLTTTNGGVFSNSCIYLNGAGNIDINPASAGFNYTTNLYKSGAFNIDPAATQASTPVSAFNVPAPNCAGLTDRGNINLTSSGTVTLQPGRYGSISINGAYNITLNPGLYCISNGFTIAGAANTTGHGITLYISGGGFNNNGAGNLDLDAPNTDDPAGFWIRGMLIYIPASNTSTIALSGNGAFNYSYQGTIYAPNGQIVSHGASNTTQNAQLVAKKIVLDGAANMNYDGSGGYPSFSQSATLDMQE